jgi:uncharacterized OsmC-like protein
MRPDAHTGKAIIAVLDSRDATQPRSRLGEILLQNESITQDQLRHALEEQARLKLPIGQTLLRLNYVTDEAMRQALGQQLNVPYLDLDNVVIDRSLARLVDRAFAKRHILMPVARMGSTLTVAMDDPTATSVVEELARMTGFTINAVTSSGKAIVGAFRRIYEEDVDNAKASAGNGDTVDGADRPDSAAPDSDLFDTTPMPVKAPGAAPADTISLSLDWGGELRFRNSWGSPAIELHSGTPGVTSPPQALGYAIMACMAMDVVHVVEKGRGELRAMSVKLMGQRAHEHPRRFLSVTLHFDVTGRVDAPMVERAIELSRTKYCSVWNSLNPDIDFKATHTIHE